MKRCLMPTLKLEPAETPNDLICSKLPPRMRIKIVSQLIFRLDYAMWAMFNVHIRTRYRLVAKEWRREAVEKFLDNFSYTECIKQAELCRKGARKSLPAAVFAALYMDAVRIEKTLFWALQDFMVNYGPFAVKFRTHDLVHSEYLGCECTQRLCKCKLQYNVLRKYRAATYEDHFFARRLVDGRTLFDLCVECAAEASDDEISLLRHYLQRRGCTITSLQDTRLALMSMWMYEHAQRPTFQHGPPPSLRVKRRATRFKLREGSDVPKQGVPAFGA